LRFDASWTDKISKFDAFVYGDSRAPGAYCSFVTIVQDAGCDEFEEDGH
jgi:hypothetical protein